MIYLVIIYVIILIDPDDVVFYLLDRLTDRNEQLMSMIEETKQQIDYYNIESKNSIADMNAELNLTLDKLHDYQKSADTIERQRIDNRDKHNYKMNLLQDKYENYRKIELSKIKIISIYTYFSNLMS